MKGILSELAKAPRGKNINTRLLFHLIPLFIILTPTILCSILTYKIFPSGYTKDILRLGVIFDNDSSRVAGDISVKPTKSVRNLTVHPLQTLLLFPIGHSFSLLSNKLFNHIISKKIGAQVLTLLTHALIALLLYIIFIKTFIKAEDPKVLACLTTLLSMTSFSMMTFAIIPESHIYAALGVLIICIALIRREITPALLLFGWLIAFGNVITHFVIGLFGAVCSQFPFKNKKFFIAGVVSLSFLFIVLASFAYMLQHALFSSGFNGLSFNNVKNESHSSPMLGSLQGIQFYVRRIELLFIHLFSANFINWESLSNRIGIYGLATMGSNKIKFPIFKFSVLLHFIFCCHLILESVIGIYKLSYPGIRVLVFCVFTVAFEAVLHFIYGHSYFLYSATWTMALILILAIGLAPRMAMPRHNRQFFIFCSLVLITFLQISVNTEALSELIPRDLHSTSAHLNIDSKPK